MSYSSFLNPLIGGALIGLSVTMMLVFNGRIAGVSGILAGGMTSPKTGPWRVAFVAGLVVGGVLLKALNPEFLTNTSDRTWLAVGIAGLLVGFGTVMGGGCTSGHGICGISRLSIRSIVATVTFMVFGFLSVAFMNFILGGRP